MEEKKLFNRPVIKLCKFGMKVCCPKSEKVPNLSMIIEVIVAQASALYQNTNPYLNVFKTSLKFLVGYEKLSNNYSVRFSVVRKVKASAKKK